MEFPLSEIALHWFGETIVMRGCFLINAMFVFMCVVYFYDMIGTVRADDPMTALAPVCVLVMFSVGLALTIHSGKTSALIWSALGISSLIRPFSTMGFTRSIATGLVYCVVGSFGTMAFLFAYFPLSIFDLFNIIKRRRHAIRFSQNIRQGN